MECSKGVASLYGLLLLLVLIMSGVVIQAGKADKKISWALFSFSLIFGLVGLLLLALLDCSNGQTSREKVFKFTIPILTGVMAVCNMVAMIMAKPDKPVLELITPHFANVAFFVVSIMTGITVCGSTGWLSNTSTQNIKQEENRTDNQDTEDVQGVETTAVQGEDNKGDEAEK